MHEVQYNKLNRDSITITSLITNYMSHKNVHYEEFSSNFIQNLIPLKPKIQRGSFNQDGTHLASLL